MRSEPASWKASAIGFVLVGLAVMSGCAGQRTAGRPADLIEIDTELESKAASARTPSEHEEVAVLYERQARVATEDVEKHRRLADAYRTLQTSGRGASYVGMATHCNSLAATYGQIAQESRSLAALHRQAAVDAK